MKTEGLRRPPSKTSMHQSRRLLASAQSHPDVSDLSQTVPHPSPVLFRVCVKEHPHLIKTFTIITVRSFLASLALTSFFIFLHLTCNLPLTVISAPFYLTLGKSQMWRGLSHLLSSLSSFSLPRMSWHCPAAQKVRGKVGRAESPLLVRLQPQQLTVMISRPSPLALKAMTLRTRRTCLVVWSIWGVVGRYHRKVEIEVFLLVYLVL